VVAAGAGTAVEWYDFALFGAFATVLADVFFGSEHSAVTLLGAFAVYGTAFIARPFGAVLFGRHGDRLGRRGVLVLVVLVMSLATAAVGVVPTYATIGLLAPVLLLGLRATQGVAAGGELGIAAVFVVESAPEGRRGRYAGLQTLALAAGIAAGLGIGAVMTAALGEDGTADGWWRLAFQLALPLGLVGLWLRRSLHEAAIFEALAPGDPRQRRVGETWRRYRAQVCTGFMVIGAGSLVFNTFAIFLPNHLADTTDLSLPAALSMGVVGLVVGGLVAIVAGDLSDRVGRRPVVVVGAGALVVLAPVLVDRAASGSLIALGTAEVLAGVATACLLSFAFVAELFPTELRSTGMALSGGLGAALVGGTAPLLEQAAYTATGAELLPGLYVAVGALLAALAIWRSPETAFTPLP
jgi:MHS family proline/betaine transporter-like MFS transporter